MIDVPTNPVELLEIGRGIFAFALFSLSVFAWSKRRHPALIMVATAFFLFFAKTLFDFFLPTTILDFARVTVDFVALALFFVAIVVRPRHDPGDGAG
jgi:hypothetical protein